MRIIREVTVLAGALTLLLTGVNTLAQPERPVPACSQKTFAAIKPFPKMEYECPDDATDFDSKDPEVAGKALRDSRRG
jgi:hypothetical protein